MKQRLELEVFLSSVSYCETGLQIVPAQRYRVGDTELVVFPLRRDLVQHGVRKAEVQLHRRVSAAVGKCGGFRRRFAKVFPFGRASEAMLRETLGCFVGRRTKVLHEAVSSRSCKSRMS